MSSTTPLSHGVSLPSYEIVAGKIVTVFQGLNVYLVDAPGTVPFYASVVFTGGTSADTVCMRPVLQYQVGAQVAVLRLNSSVPTRISESGISTIVNRSHKVYDVTGYIIGVLPTAITSPWNGRQCPPIYAYGDVHDGFNGPLAALNKRFIDDLVDFNTGIPVDAVPGSDVGVIGPEGTGYGASRYHAWMKGSELAGVWAFGIDHVLRIASYNYERWTAAGEEWLKSLDGKITEFDQFTPFEWESFGALSNATAGFIENTDGGQFGEGKNGAAVLPVDGNLQAVRPRHVVMRGGYADLKRELVVLPRRLNEEATVVNKRDNAEAYAGLLDVQQHVSGLFTARSAQGFIFEKTLRIPVPISVKPLDEYIEAEEGETVSTAKKLGFVYGPPAEAPEEGEAPPPETSDSALFFDQFYDQLAYVFGYYGPSELTLAEERWKHKIADGFGTWEGDNEEEGEEEGPSLEIVDAEIDSAKLYINLRKASAHIFNADSFFDIQLDTRDGATRYYRTRSIFAMMPDGGITLIDGYGSCILSQGGNMTLSPPGDLILRPGRRLVVIAGDDINMFAKQSVDIVAGEKDLRLAAGNNLAAVAADGMLFHAKGLPSSTVAVDADAYGDGESAEYTGIMFKANDTFRVHAGGVLVGAYSEDSLHPLRGRVVTYASKETIDTAPNGYQLYKTEFARVVGDSAFNGVSSEIVEQSGDMESYTDWSITYQSEQRANVLANQVGIAGLNVAIASTDTDNDSLFFATRVSKLLTDDASDSRIGTRFDAVRAFYSSQRGTLNDWLDMVTSSGTDGEECAPYPMLKGNPPVFHFRTEDDLGITDQLTEGVKTRVYVLPEMPWQTRIRKSDIDAEVIASDDAVQVLSFNANMAPDSEDTDYSLTQGYDIYPFPFDAGVECSYSSMHENLFDASDNGKDTITEEDLTTYFSEYEREQTTIVGYKVVGVKDFGENEFDTEE
jgi:hypothetical protein